jgi:hypothetical protein
MKEYLEEFLRSPQSVALPEEETRTTLQIILSRKTKIKDFSVKTQAF